MDCRLEENCSTSTQTTEGKSDRDYTYEEANGQNFKWTAESFDDFCRELNLSKVLYKRCIAMLKVDQDLKIKLSAVSNSEAKMLMLFSPISKTLLIAMISKA